jgi:energy-converting hydrogenase Eha subunit G
MGDISLYVWLTLGFFFGFCITAGALFWFFRRRARGACAPHEWETGPDGRLRCARCGLVASERD